MQIQRKNFERKQGTRNKIGKKNLKKKLFTIS